MVQKLKKKCHNKNLMPNNNINENQIIIKIITNHISGIKLHIRHTQ